MRQYIQHTNDGFNAFNERKYIEIRQAELTDITTVAENAGLSDAGYSEADLIIMKRYLFLSTQ